MTHSWAEPVSPRLSPPAPRDRANPDRYWPATAKSIPQTKRGATATAAPRIFMQLAQASAQFSVRTDRPAPARAPVAAWCDEAIAITTATIVSATAATSPAAATTAAPATPATAAAATTTGFRRGRRRGRDNERRSDEADRIDQHQRRRRQSTLQKVRTCLDLSHKEHLHFRKRRGALPRIKLASLRPVQARSENR